MTRPLRVLTIGHSHTVGMNRAMWRRLAEDPGFDITVAAPRFFRGDLRPLHIDPEPEGSALHLVPIDAAWTQWIHIFRYDQAQLRKLLHDGEFDVVHAWEEPYVRAGYQIANTLRDLPSRFIFRTAQNLFKHYPPPFGYFERATLRRAQAWIAGGNLVFQTMLKRGYPRDRGSVLSLSVDLQDFHPASEAERASVLQELELQAPVIGFVGRLSRDKGLDVLMSALELLPKSLSWNALLLGSGPYKEKVLAWAERKGWQKRVKIKLAKHSEAPRYVAAMDLLVAPSQTTSHWREQFGRMIVEAFACKVPVIGSDSGEIPYVVSDAGMIVPERDPALWAEAIAKLLQDTDKRRELANRGLERVNLYSAATVSRQFAEFYRWVAQQPVSAAASVSAVAVAEPSPVQQADATSNGVPIAYENAAAPWVSRKKTRRIVSIAHSYCVALNRRLAHEMALAGQGKLEVSAVAPAFFHGDFRPLAMETADDEACTVENVNTHFSRQIHVMLYGRRLREILLRGWDLVHCWEEPYILCGGQVAMWTPKETPLVYWTCQNLNKRYPLPFNWIEDYCIDRCAGWAALGESSQDTMLQRGYGNKPHTVMPLGVDLNQFYPNPEIRSRTLQKLGWDDSTRTPTVGFVGRFVQEKGLELLMEALAAVNVPWRALFIGNGPMRHRLKDWEQSRPDRVRVLTNVKHDEVPSYLNAMDMLCAPSQTTRHWREQFGRMIVEAFACGVPVLASDSGEIPHVIGDAGVIVPEKDLTRWAQAIAGLLQDSDRRRELSLHGLERVREHYTWKVIAQKYLDFFEEVTVTA